MILRADHANRRRETWIFLGIFFAVLVFYMIRISGDFDRSDNLAIRANIAAFPWYHWFLSDWGVGNLAYYRPLQILVFYVLHGVGLGTPTGYWIFQCLLVAIAAAMFGLFVGRFLPRTGPRLLITFAFASSVSLESSLVFVSDSASIFQVLCTLGLLALALDTRRNVSVSATAGFLFLAAVALLSKESGLIAVSAGLLPIALRIGRELRSHRAPSPNDLVLVTSAIAIISIYFVVRTLVLQGAPSSGPFAQNGYFFGTPFQELNSAGWETRALVAFYNVLTHALSVFVPIVGPMGEFPDVPSAIRSIPYFALVIFIWMNRKSVRGWTWAWVALTVVMATAILGFAYFRYRMHVLSDACYFLAVAAIISDRSVSPRATAILLGAIITSNIVYLEWTEFHFPWGEVKQLLKWVLSLFGRG